MGKLSRNKGASFEREVVRLLNQYNLNAKRTAPMQAGHSNYFGDVECDLGLVECKRRARGFSLLYEALADADCVIFRDDRKKPLIAFELEDFLTREGLND